MSKRPSGNKKKTSKEKKYKKPPDQAWFIPNDEEQSVYRFIIAASRRSRQLQAGARPSISTNSRKPTKIGMQEIKSADIEVEITSQQNDTNVEEEPII